MVTDLAEVFRLGTAKAKENLAFRRHLAAHHSGDTAFQILASEIEEQVDCTRCANCCRYSKVTVSEADIEQIAEYLGIKVKDVIRLYTEPDADNPSLRILGSSKDGCVFLDHNLCLIYEARPTPCREFPHVTVGTHSLGGRRASQDRWAPLCPIIFNAIESYKAVSGFHPREKERGSSCECF